MSRCTGITARGDRCRNPSLTGADRCRVHSEHADPDQLRRLLDLLRAGNYLEIAARAAGVELDTLDRLLLEQAQAEGEALAIARIARAAAENWQAAAWLLERQFPERWGRPAVRPQEDSAAALDTIDGLDELANRRSERRAGVRR